MMADNKPDLKSLQAWMQTVLTQPGEVNPETASEKVAEMATLVQAPAALSAAEGLAIYANAYRLRLLECLRAEYPCLLHAVGEHLFQHFARDYLDHHPPHAYSLNVLAENFAQHLARTRPASDPATGKRESWPDFLIDLASLERAFVEVYDGPGDEGRERVGAGEVARLTSAQLAGARFAASESLRLLAFAFPVREYFRSVRSQGDPGFPAPEANWLALVRVNYRVHMYQLSRGEYGFLGALIRGRSTAEATGQPPTGTADSQHGLSSVGRRLSDWAGKGFFRRVES